jgi:hypothetical protein
MESDNAAFRARGAESVEYNQKINYALHKFSGSYAISSAIVSI